MIHSILRILEVIAFLGCLCSSIYYIVCLWSAAAFLRGKEKNVPPANSLPPVSILKPLKGIDPGIYASFRSHCLQEYSAYEIVFGVSDADDPAIAAVKQVQQEFPRHAIRLVICPKQLGANVKVSNLVQMLAQARYEHLIVNDSDIRVEPDYLRRVVAPLADDRVGMVTCLYRGVPAATLGSRIESLGIATDFCASVLVARQLEGGLHFGLGSTLAFRRRDLERIGGFLPVVDFLADDYELGRRIAGLGLTVQLSEVVIETHLPAYDLRRFFAHQLRWARGIRDARAAGYIGLIATFGLQWGVASVLAARGAVWSWAALAVIALLRFAVALKVGHGVLHARQLLKNIWLLPLRDLIAVAVWLASFTGDTVTWRGDRFELKNGRLTRVASSSNS
jgi:ceramide glucosyltransferase